MRRKINKNSKLPQIKIVKTILRATVSLRNKWIFKSNNKFHNHHNKKIHYSLLSLSHRDNRCRQIYQNDIKIKTKIKVIKQCEYVM
jgi:hypothetical protein